MPDAKITSLAPPDPRWHTDETDDLPRLQALQDKVRGYPKPATDAQGRPVAGAVIVQHWASIDSEDPGKTETPRKRLRALPPDCDLTKLDVAEQTVLTDATAGELPTDWKD